MSAQVGTRPATSADVPFLLGLRRATMHEHLAASGVGMSDDDHLGRLMHRFECAQVIQVDGAAVGMIKVFRGDDAWEIVQFQISPQAQGRGIGRHALEHVITQAASLRVPLRLGVLKTSPARRLYERLGFVVDGEDALEFRMVRAPDA